MKETLTMDTLADRMRANKITAMLLLSIFLLLSPSFFPQVKNAAVAPVLESEAAETARAWALAVSNEDSLGLEKLLDAQYIHIHATGLVESKAEFIGALKSGARNYEPIIFEDVSTRVFAAAAIVNGRFNLKVLARGKTIEGVNRFSMMIIKTPQGPKVVSFQATALQQRIGNN